jgi:hypothetical protein
MFSQNPRPDAFRLTIPDTFFIPEICNKYNQLLKQYPYVLKTIDAMLIESIQSIDSPAFGFTAISQNTIDSNNAGYDGFQTPKESFQKLTEKTFSVTFRHTNGFMTYFLMLEHFFKRYEMGQGSSRKPFGSMYLETLMPTPGQVLCRIRFDKCILVGIDNLSLTYSGLNRDASTYTCTFAYSEFSTSFELPQLKLKQ